MMYGTSDLHNLRNAAYLSARGKANTLYVTSCNISGFHGTMAGQTSYIVQNICAFACHDNRIDIYSAHALISSGTPIQPSGCYQQFDDDWQ